VTGYLHLDEPEPPSTMTQTQGGQSQSQSQTSAATEPDERPRLSNPAHNWAEAHVPGLGWVGFDPSLGVCVTEAHVRVAIGLDYLGAAPTRGSRYGGMGETFDVKVAVEDPGARRAFRRA